MLPRPRGAGGPTPRRAIEAAGVARRPTARQPTRRVCGVFSAEPDQSDPDPRAATRKRGGCSDGAGSRALFPSGQIIRSPPSHSGLRTPRTHYSLQSIGRAETQTARRRDATQTGGGHALDGATSGVDGTARGRTAKSCERSDA